MHTKIKITTNELREMKDDGERTPVHAQEEQTFGAGLKWWPFLMK